MVVSYKYLTSFKFGYMSISRAWVLGILVVLISCNPPVVESQDMSSKPQESSKHKTVTQYPSSSKEVPKEIDIEKYLASHTFTYGGNGHVSFTNGNLEVRGGRAKLIGTYRRSSNNSVEFNMQAVDGDFDASNNPTCYGRFVRNSDGTLTETLSDGHETKTYTLNPK